MAQSKLFILIMIKLKNKLKQFLKRILQEIVTNKIILGTSDAWSMSPLSWRPNEPPYCIED